MPAPVIFYSTLEVVKAYVVWHPKLFYFDGFISYLLFYAIFLSDTTLLVVSWTLQEHACFRAIKGFFHWLELSSFSILCDSLQDLLECHLLCKVVPGHMSNVSTALSSNPDVLFSIEKFYFLSISIYFYLPTIIFYIICSFNIFSLMWVPWG